MTQPDTFTCVALFALFAAVINSVGIFTILKHKVWAEKAKTHIMCFAAGVLISTPLMFAFPEAIRKNRYAGFAALGGFLFMLVSNQFIKAGTKQKGLAFGVTAIEGIAIHSFVDGIMYTITFSASLLIGLLSGIGLVIHEFAEGVIAFSVLIKGDVSKKKAVVCAFIAAALTTPIGAFISYPLVNRLHQSLLGLLLGFVAGVLIYISASHLLPEAREGEKHSVWAFLGGVCLALGIVLTKLL